MTKRKQDGAETLLSEEEIRHRHMSDPEALRRAERAVERVKRGDPPGPGVTAEELADFLREHG